MHHFASLHHRNVSEFVHGTAHGSAKISGCNFLRNLCALIILQVELSPGHRYNPGDQFVRPV